LKPCCRASATPGASSSPPAGNGWLRGQGDIDHQHARARRSGDCRRRAADGC
jgi:hypothetical protein